MTNNIKRRAAIIARYQPTGRRLQGEESVSRRNARWHKPVALAVLAASTALIGGCSVVGPTTVSNGRPAYAKAIASTNNQQILQFIVNARYQEPSGLLAVASVNASVAVSGSVGVNAGLISPDESFAGNLVPLSAGATYEENPTVTYTPVNGVDYLGEVLGPVPLDVTMLTVQASFDPGAALTILVKSINGLRNPAYRFGEKAGPDPRFARLAQLFTELHHAELLTFAKDPDGTLFIMVPARSGSASPQIDELLDLLGVPEALGRTGEIALPVRMGTGTPSANEVRVEIRSVVDLIRIASAAMAVPDEQISSGLAADTPALGLVGTEIRVLASETPPHDAMVAVRAHEVWYYISSTDIRSKSYFALLESLIGARIADAAVRGKSGPILTLPVAK